MRQTIEADVRVVPANEATFGDIQTVLGSAGYAHKCQCQRFRLPGREWWEAWQSGPAWTWPQRLRDQTRCGDPDAGATSGLVAYLGDEPVGWCAVAPRSEYVRLGQAAWKGRPEDRDDDGVWAAVCFITRTGYRYRGVSRALARAAVAFARARGARALEGYPMITTPGKEVTWGELHVGSRSIFEAAGLTEIGHPSPRRVVMRIEF